jgi:pimeloyl-ACP methyl ester carboxylesterase
MPTATINGLKHYYDDVGSGDVLVMLHGANGSAHAFEEHYPELSKRFRVIAPDMRAMGRSEHVTSLPASAWVDDLGALLEHLGIQKAHVFGVSLGSRVAMRMALDYPDRVRSLMVTSPHTNLTKELNDNMNRTSGDGQNLGSAEQDQAQRRHGDDWRDVLRNYYNIRNEAALQQYYNLRVSQPLGEVVGTFSESVTKISCPILVIQTDNLSTGRSVFDHAIELKNELPDQVRLAIVPSYSPRARGVPAATLRQCIVEFVDSAVAVAAGA